MAQLVVSLIFKLSVMGLNPIKGFYFVPNKKLYLIAKYWLVPGTG